MQAGIPAAVSQDVEADGQAQWCGKLIAVRGEETKAAPGITGADELGLGRVSSDARTDGAARADLSSDRGRRGLRGRHGGPLAEQADAAGRSGFDCGRHAFSGGGAQP